VLRFASRYFPGETMYLDEVDPAAHADVVVEHTDPTAAAPHLAVIVD
jgi:hypothetical protein